MRAWWSAWLNGCTAGQQSVERVDFSCFLQVVAASALVAGLHMFAANGEVVKRWTSEILQAVQSRNAMVQYHAIALQVRCCWTHCILCKHQHVCTTVPACMCTALNGNMWQTSC